MATLFGVLLLVGGFTALAVVRPWQSHEPGALDAEPSARAAEPRGRDARKRRATRERRDNGERRDNREPRTREPRDTGEDRTAVALARELGSAEEPAAVALARELVSAPASRKPQPRRRATSPAHAAGAAAIQAGGSPAPVAPEWPEVRRHRLESIQRGRRVASESGQSDIVLPEWLGPVSRENGTHEIGSREPAGRESLAAGAVNGVMDGSGRIEHLRAG